jgi:hypothetical protein
VCGKRALLGTRRVHGLAAYPLAIYESTARRHCFDCSVATRTGGGQANGRDRSHVHRARSGNRGSSWSGDDGPIGTSTASANDTGRTFDSVRARYDTSQQGKDRRNSKQRRVHHWSPRSAVFRQRSPLGTCAAQTESGGY